MVTMVTMATMAAMATTATATTPTKTTTATAPTATSNPDHVSQIQPWVKPAITVRRKIIFNPNVTREREIMPHQSKSRKWKNKKGAIMLRQSSNQKTRPQLL
jgi:hypothetical protein